METSIFQVAGPVMIGPSSSHTAGAAKLGRIAGLLCGEAFDSVLFELHGSFAKTGKGHGTDKALAAGVLGFAEDDESICQAFTLAKEAGVALKFCETELVGVHENSVRLTFFQGGKELCQVVGSSTGGGDILVASIDGFQTELRAVCPTLFIRQEDKPGVIRSIATILAEKNVNIAAMRLARKRRSGEAACTLELDAAISQDTVEAILASPDIVGVSVIDPRI